VEFWSKLSAEALLSAPLLATESAELRPGERGCTHALLDQFERRRWTRVPANRQASRNLTLKPLSIHDHRIAVKDGRLVSDERVIANAENDCLILAIPQGRYAHDAAEIRGWIRLGDDDPKVRRRRPARGGHQEGVTAPQHLRRLQHGFRGGQRFQFRFDCRDLALGLLAGA